MASTSCPFEARVTRSALVALVALALHVAHPALIAAQDDGGPIPDGGGATGLPAIVEEAAAGEPEASEPEASGEADSGPAQGVHLGELASRTRVTLQHARPLFHAPRDVSDIARLLPRTEAEIRHLGDPSRLALIPQLAQRELADLRQEWRRQGSHFEDWQATLTERAAALEQVRAELGEDRRRWAELRRQIEITEVRPGRRERIITTYDAVRAAHDTIDEQLDLVLDLQERVSELSIMVEDVSEQLRAATAEYRERLFVRDRPPLWVALGATTDAEDPASGNLLAQAQESWGLRMQHSASLLSRELPAVLRQLVLFVVFIGLMLMLQRRSRAWPKDDPSLEVARGIARRPFSTALLVTLILTPFAVRNAPIVLYDALFVLMLVPLVRVLPPLAPRNVRPLLYFLSALLLADRIEGTIAEGSELRRVLLLFECAVGASALTYWVRRNARIADAATRVARRVMVPAAIVIALALVANVLGYVFLATVLMDGTGFSLYAGLALLALVLVLQSLLDLGVRSEAGRRLRSLREHGPLVEARVLRFLSGAALLAWVVSMLEGYGLWQPLFKWGEDTLEKTREIGSLEISLGAVGLALLILLATLALARITRFVLELDVLPRMRLEPGVDGAVSGLTRYLVGGVGLLLALAALGIDASQIALVAGALGVGVGFGLQSIVANFIAGIVLMIERPVRLGDFIEVGPLVGRVERIGLRSSTVRALDGAEVIVPNESLISREVVNWTLSDRKRRLQVKVGVAYGTDPARALEIIEGVAVGHRGVLDSPSPEGMFEGFGASSLDFSLQFWTEDFADALRLQSAIGIKVHDALVAAGIEIPFPQQDVNVKSLPLPAPAIVPIETSPTKS